MSWSHPPLGPYEQLAELGRGGMGVTVLARSLVANEARLVVIKRPHAALVEDEEVRRRFRHETELAHRLEHPNLVRTWGSGHDARGPFLVLEYVHGTTWDDLLDRAALRGRRPSPEGIAYVGARLARALQAIHAAPDRSGGSLEIVHRDVSPANVLLSREGAVKLGDFGVSRSRLREATTDARHVLGRLPFLAPEYLRGRVSGPALDVYALGVSLWSAFAGRLPFEAPTERGLLRRIFEEGVPRLGAWAPGVSKELEELVARACAMDPAARCGLAELESGLSRALPEARGAALLRDEIEEFVGADLDRREVLLGVNGSEVGRGY